MERCSRHRETTGLPEAFGKAGREAGCLPAGCAQTHFPGSFGGGSGGGKGGSTGTAAPGSSGGPREYSRPPGERVARPTPQPSAARGERLKLWVCGGGEQHHANIKRILEKRKIIIIT